MPVSLTKDSPDLGIVVKDLDAALAFYRDLLGLEEVQSIPMPNGTMRRLMCGTAAIKLLKIDPQPPDTVPGGIQGATGLRYWTMSVDNIDDVVREIEAAGHPVPIPVTELRPGIRIAIAADPDGNWVEFVQMD